MHRLSKKTEYALRALLCMAREPLQSVHTIQAISHRENIPTRFLEQILLTLRQGGLLQSRRGAGGGYILRESPDRIRVGQVVHLIEGAGSSDPEPANDNLAVRTLFQQLDEEWARILDAKSIGDLLRIEQQQGSSSFEI